MQCFAIRVTHSCSAIGLRPWALALALALYQLQFCWWAECHTSLQKSPLSIWDCKRRIICQGCNNPILSTPPTHHSIWTSHKAGQLTSTLVQFFRRCPRHKAISCWWIHCQQFVQATSDVDVVSNFTGSTTFRVYNSHGLSSSLAKTTKGTSHERFKPTKILTVIVLEASALLGGLVAKQNRIGTLKTDMQGFDLTALRNLWHIQVRMFFYTEGREADLSCRQRLLQNERLLDGVGLHDSYKRRQRCRWCVCIQTSSHRFRRCKSFRELNIGIVHCLDRGLGPDSQKMLSLQRVTCKNIYNGWFIHFVIYALSF